MVELSVDDAQRLARQFLTGKAAPADVSRLAAALPEDQTLALELLAQMQAALDDVAPSALSIEQDRSVDARIEALIAPRIKKRGLFGWLRKLFRAAPKKKKEEPSRRRRRGAEPEPVAEIPVPAGADGGAMEETMPLGGAAGDEVMPGAAAPAFEAPAAPSSARVAAAKPPARKGLPWASLLTGLAILLLVAALAAGGGWWWKRHRHAHAVLPAPSSAAPQAPAAGSAGSAAVPAALPATPQRTQAPTPQPTASSPRRARDIAGGSADEPLPAYVPPMTPQPSGQLTE